MSNYPAIDFNIITKEVDSILGKLTESEPKDTNQFPIEVFPATIQEIIKETNQHLSFPVDFVAASLLYSAALAVGNTHKVEVMKGWQEGAVLYLAIVGQPGTNKSGPLSFALSPIFERDKQTFKDFEAENLKYKEYSNLARKDRENLGIEEPVKPVWQKHIIQDFTPEALAEVHKSNKRGIGVYADELAAWFKNFNRYNKGSEQEFWLSNWSGKSIIIDRKSGDPVLIPSPFVPVIGTIQNGILNEIGKDSRSQNGFIDRILFVMPEGLKKPYWSETELCPSVIQEWQTIVLNLLNLSLDLDDSNNPKPTILRFNSEALRVLKDWQMENTDRCNNATNATYASLYSKLEIYAIRLSLILQMMRWAAGESDKNNVGIDAVNGALKLIEYFRNTAEKVHNVITNHNPLDKHPSDLKQLYELLPQYFTTAQGVEIANSLEIPERNFKRFLTNETELFERVRRGEYSKKL